MIKLKKLTWSNAFSYGENNELALDTNPLTQIVGLNGHGKSSIALILEEVLFNKNSKGIKKGDILNRNSKSKSYNIQLDFEKDNDSFKIITNRSSTQSVKLYKNGEDISAHTATGTYGIIQEIIGCDHKTFTQIVYQSSSASLEFLTATDANRKKFLIDLLDLTKYVEAGEVFKKLLKEAQDSLLVINTQITSTNSTIFKLSSIDLTEQPVQEVPEAPRSLIEQVQNLQEKIKSIDSINKNILQNNKYKELLDSLILETHGDRPVFDLAEAKGKTSVLDKIISDANTFITKMNKLGSKCPTCLQEVDTNKLNALVTEQKHACSKAQEDREVIEEQVSEFKRRLAAWEKEQAKHEEYEKYHALYNPSLETEVISKEELQKNIAQLETEITKTNKLIQQIAESNNKIISHNAKISLVQEQLSEARQALAGLESQFTVLNQRVSVLQILVKTFSSTGLVAYKIECLIKDLEATTNQYLTELSSGRFQLSFVVSNDKLNVVITDNGRDIDISALSSGERARVNAAALLGIRKLMQGLSNNRINLLVLDETIENLDLEGKEKLVEVLLNEEYLNTFIISHSFSHPLLERVYVVKENNISRIDNG